MGWVNCNTLIYCPSGVWVLLTKVIMVWELYHTEHELLKVVVVVDSVSIIVNSNYCVRRNSREWVFPRITEE